MTPREPPSPYQGEGEGGLDKVLAKVYNNPEMAKYDSLRKLERNRLLREFKEAHPELSLREIGEVFNISESRVWRILYNNKGRG